MSPFIEDHIEYQDAVKVSSDEIVDPMTVPWRPKCMGSEGYWIFMNITLNRHSRPLYIVGGRNWEEGKALAHYICQVHNNSLKENQNGTKQKSKTIC